MHFVRKARNTDGPIETVPVHFTEVWHGERDRYFLGRGDVFGLRGRTLPENCTGVRYVLMAQPLRNKKKVAFLTSPTRPRAVKFERNAALVRLTVLSYVTGNRELRAARSKTVRMSNSPNYPRGAGKVHPSVPSVLRTETLARALRIFRVRTATRKNTFLFPPMAFSFSAVFSGVTASVSPRSALQILRERICGFTPSRYGNSVLYEIRLDTFHNLLLKRNRSR